MTTNEPERSRFKALLYRAGVLVTPEEQARLRTLSFQDRVMEQSIPQMLLPIPLILLLGALYKGVDGLTIAAAICGVAVLAVVVVQQRGAVRTSPAPDLKKDVPPKRPGGAQPPKRAGDGPSKNAKKKR